jgi:hypothetical protein
MRCPFHHRDAALIAALISLTERIETMADEFATLSAKVDDTAAKIDASTAKVDIAISLLQSFKAQLDAALVSADPRALTALSDKLGAAVAGLDAETTKLSEVEAALAPTPAPAP